MCKIHDYCVYKSRTGSSGPSGLTRIRTIALMVVLAKDHSSTKTDGNQNLLMDTQVAIMTFLVFVPSGSTALSTPLCMDDY
ncbi:hypothetical protein F7725_022107 [Dissostichus mawsoni]|uniref:Uncharacterized protein n=1 Tax=Dissostichus mawsoni TaxID=36200 RepID=A0A7J5ZH37_DISMA|nr:hypothetical protein F7725_022107 [Dissostichus mawsoni]